MAQTVVWTRLNPYMAIVRASILCVALKIDQ